VITNADVKKSGKIIDTPNIFATAPARADAHGEAQAHKAAEKIANERRLQNVKLVADLEKQLAAIEQMYYEENDLNRRDTELVKRFNDVKARLDAARTQVQ
jgi:hypothetical protein